MATRLYCMGLYYTGIPCGILFTWVYVCVHGFAIYLCCPGLCIIIFRGLLFFATLYFYMRCCTVLSHPIPCHSLLSHPLLFSTYSADLMPRHAISRGMIQYPMQPETVASPVLYYMAWHIHSLAAHGVI